jgi:hypothetical protein
MQYSRLWPIVSVAMRDIEQIPTDPILHSRSFDGELLHKAFQPPRSIWTSQFLKAWCFNRVRYPPWAPNPSEGVWPSLENRGARLKILDYCSAKSLVTTEAMQRSIATSVSCVRAKFGGDPRLESSWRLRRPSRRESNQSHVCKRATCSLLVTCFGCLIEIFEVCSELEVRCRRPKTI